MPHRRTIRWIVVGLGVASSLSVTAHARNGWQSVSDRFAEAIQAESALIQQATALTLGEATIEYEHAEATRSAIRLDYASRESLRRLDVYRQGRAVREHRARTRARALVYATRGGLARLVLEDLERQSPVGASRVGLGRDLRWMIRRDIQELAAYQRAERRARAELLQAERQLQAQSVIATVHDMQAEIISLAQQATNPALHRATQARRRLRSRHPSPARAQSLVRAQITKPRTHDSSLTRLARPVHGRIIGRFGDYDDPGLKVPMWRNGLELKARPNDLVRAPADGRVVTITSLPGFEQIVVLDHGAGQLTMLGRLWNPRVGLNDEVRAGDPIAQVAPKGIDDGLGPTVYLELRRGDTPIDPAPLLR